jgi:hypothetical protein
VLNWTEGRASDVSREVLEGFGRYADRYGGDRLELYLGLNHLRIGAASRTIEWMGRRGVRHGAYVRSGEPHGDRCRFDVIALATGFGLEEGVEEAEGTNSYWRNDRLGQPQLSGGRATYLLSGFGDGALIDLCRLSVERFRQDTILYELFGANLEKLEHGLRSLLGNDFGRTNLNAYDIMEHNLPPEIQNLIEAARKRLLERLRKDTIVVLHASGRNGENTSLRNLFGPDSSFLNRTLLYLLYRCGGFVLSLGGLDEAKREFTVQDDKVVRRYGANTLAALRALFSDPEVVSDKLNDMKAAGRQVAKRRWPLGAFPHLVTSA